MLNERLKEIGAGRERGGGGEKRREKEMGPYLISLSTDKKHITHTHNRTQLSSVVCVRSMYAER